MPHLVLSRVIGLIIRDAAVFAIHQQVSRTFSFRKDKGHRRGKRELVKVIIIVKQTLSNYFFDNY